MSGTWSSLLNKFLYKKRKKGRNTSSVVLLSAFGGSLFHHGIILSVKSFFPGWTNFCVSVFSPSLSLQSFFENSLKDHFYLPLPSNLPLCWPGEWLTFSSRCSRGDILGLLGCLCDSPSLGLNSVEAKVQRHPSLHGPSLGLLHLNQYTPHL